MGGFMNGLGAALSGYATDRFGNPTGTSQQTSNRIKRGGIIGAIGQGINRYRAAQQQAQQSGTSPQNQMDMSPVPNPSMTPPAQSVSDMNDSAPPMPAQSSNSYMSADPTMGGQGAAMADSGDMFSSPMDGIESFGSGQIVTKPTLAIVGEKAPEIIQPLLDQPGQRVPSVLGQGLSRTRWKHLTGPNASARYRPETADLPIRPGPITR